MPDYATLLFTSEFVESLEKLSPADIRRVRHALGLLDENDHHPSLNVHQLKGQQAGLWTAYASKGLRITFERMEASRHYGN